MSKTIANRYAKRAAARRRAIRRKAAAWKQRARRAFTLMLVAGGMMGSAGVAHAQMGGMGQAAMAPTGGLVNRAVTRLQDLEANGPGWLYYGVNAADRGLGYNGSYMTLGGYIPYAEDDLGGLWAADLRGHFSEYGGFFSNVGAVRKQFLGGTLLGVGVYWDYDGDANQYELRNMPCGTEQFGQFGHSYNQVGVSAEWLTDYGNLRSNGYIPVGTTAYTAGAPGSPFYQNYVMCQHGLDAALTGADLEVGAYVPGLSDWAGMVSVGGYALGNDRYDWYSGTQANKDVVPWFGGVYTRLDMTFVKNWDFSLQANNDSYFDWTGFARLTYRMGGSRRRNVPDQMEQPMMRNEHIVRAHQTPVVAINPSNGTPWRVIHVNNAAVAGGNGTAESPFTRIEPANAAATNPYDIVLVDRGIGTYNQTAAFSPLAANQYFIGNGTPFYLPAECCDPINIARVAGPRPVLTNPTGASINLTNGLLVNNFDITGSQIGISGSGNLSSGLARPPLPFPYAPPSYGSATGDAFVNNVTISGTKLAGQTGIYLDKTTGTVDFQNTIVQNATNGGFVVQGGDPNVNFSGQIVSSGSANGGFVSPIVQVVGTTGGTINLAVGGAPAGTTVANKISDEGGAGIIIADNAGGTINVGNATLTNTTPTAISVENSFATINVTDSAIDKNTTGAAIDVNGGAPVFDYKGKITNEAGNMLSVVGTTGGSVTLTAPAGSPFTENGDGILVDNNAGDVTVLGANINSQKDGILVAGSSGVNTFNDITISGAGTGQAGVSLQGNTGTDQFNNLSIQTTNATGFLANTANNVNVTGASSVSTNGAPAVSMTNVQNANVNFSSVASTDSPGNGVLLDKVAGSFKATNVTVENSDASGFVVRNSAGLNVLVGNANITVAANPGANGIEVTNSTSQPGGAIEFTTVKVKTNSGTGLLASGSDLVKIGGGTITATGGAAVDATNSNLDVTLASMSSTNSATNGVNLVGNEGSVTSAQTTVTTPAGVGINVVDNMPGFTANFGVTSVTNSAGIGVNIQNTIEPVPTILTSFDSLTVATTNATGFQAINGGTVNFNSPATIAATGGAALILENTVGTTNSVAGSGWTFASLNSTNATGNGILLRNLNSDLTVQGTTVVDGASATSVQIIDTQTPAGVYDIRFNSMDIRNRQSAGLAVDGIGGQVVIQSLNIDNAAAAAGSAVNIMNTSTPGGRVYINGGVISDSNGNGIFIQDSIVAIQNATVSGPFSNCVLVEANAGQTSTVSVVGSILSSAGNNGVLMQAQGGGVVNATILQSSIDVILNPIEAVVFDAGSSIFLNAANNFGTGGGPPTAGNFVLNNAAGGILQISQASTANMSAANSAATVTPSGVITFNAIVPTPPPPSP
jgi:hypothetical protein